jgi:hypothetical protein
MLGGAAALIRKSVTVVQADWEAEHLLDLYSHMKYISSIDV